MDFMKLFDQTVRDIKREVNLKVLKIPEIEQKVLDATDDVPWGPHGTLLTEIAQATKKYSECQMVFNVLWTRLEETGGNWRLVYKALTVIEFLVGHGSERAVDDIIEHTFRIAALTSFEYVEPSGKDVGLNVRKKAETIVALLNDKEKIQVVRSKAAANRDKYVGLSSKGVSFRSSATSYGSSGYGGYSDREKDSDYYVKKSEDNSEETKNSSDFKRKSEHVKVSSLPVTATEDEFDDFDPRGTSSNSAPKRSDNQSLLLDLTDAPASTVADVASSNVEVDLFADAAFTSAQAPPVSSSHNQQVDLFGDLSSSVDEFSSNTSPNQNSPINLFSSDIPQNSFDLFSSKISPQNAPTDLFSSKVSPQNASADLFSSKISQKAPTDLFSSKIPSQNAPADLFSSKTSPQNASADLFSSKISPQKAPTDLFSSKISSPNAPADLFSSKTSSQNAPADLFSSNISPSNSPADLFSSSNSPVETLATDPLASFPMNTETSDIFGAFNSAPSREERNIKPSFSNPTNEKFGVKSGIWADSLNRGLIDLNILGPKVANVGVMRDSNDAGRETTGHKGNPSTLSPPVIEDDFFSSLASSSQYHFGQFHN